MKIDLEKNEWNIACKWNDVFGISTDGNTRKSVVCRRKTGVKGEQAGKRKGGERT